MNIDTGELIRLMDNSDIPNGFVEVPDRFSKEAESLLRDEKSVFVDMQTPSQLVNWARKEKRKRVNTHSKTNNPMNQLSQAAKKAGLSYWEYMEKIHPGCVMHHSCGPAKVKEKSHPNRGGCSQRENDHGLSKSCEKFSR